MKKLFLGLIATVMFCFSSYAQNKQEAISKLYKTGMVSLVDNARPYYKDGMSYKQFTDAITAGAKLSNEENLVVTDVYNFLVKKADTGTIFNEYNKKSLEALISMPDTQVPVARICGFFCWLKALRDILNIILAAVGE